ncbi:hypothetical protein Tco_0385814 [Tanacetum coccineum]
MGPRPNQANNTLRGKSPIPYWAARKKQAGRDKSSADQQAERFHNVVPPGSSHLEPLTICPCLSLPHKECGCPFGTCMESRESLGCHQWEIGEDGAQRRRPAVLKGKGIMEHFGVQLEDTTESPEEPTQAHYKGDQNLQRLYADPSSSRVKEEYGPSTDNSSDDFTVIT